MVHATDLKNAPVPWKWELRQAPKALALLQDNYPEFAATEVFIRVGDNSFSPSLIRSGGPFGPLSNREIATTFLASSVGTRRLSWLADDPRSRTTGAERRDHDSCLKTCVTKPLLLMTTLSPLE